MIRRHNCITTCIWCSISRTVTPAAAIDSIKRDQAARLLGVDAGERLVEQQQPRLRDQRQRDGQALLLLLRQVRAPAVRRDSPDRR